MNRNSQTPPRNRTGAVLHIALGFIAAGAVAWAGIASVWPSSTGARVPSRFRTPPNHVEVAATLGRLGLTPNTLAAAGLTSEQVSVFTAAAAGHVRDNITNYRVAKESEAQAKNQADRLERRIRSGRGTAEDVTALAAARASASTARSQQQAVLDAALAEGAQEVTGPVMAKVNVFRIHKLAWDVPERYLGDERSESQWIELRDALANETIALRHNQEPDPTAQQVLQAARATVNSVAAVSNLQNLAELTAAWRTAMGQ